MRKPVHELLLTVALALVAPSSASAQTPLPDTLTRQGATGPFFVSRPAAMNDDGSIRWESFAAASRPLLRRIVADRTQRVTAASQWTGVDSPCEETTVGSVHVSGDTTSLTNMMASARAV